VLTLSMQDPYHLYAQTQVCELCVTTFLRRSHPELKRILQKSIRILHIRIFREEYSLFTNIFEYFKKVIEYLFEYSIFVSI
jgi:hypothetical protein